MGQPGRCRIWQPIDSVISFWFHFLLLIRQLPRKGRRWLSVPRSLTSVGPTSSSWPSPAACIKWTIWVRGWWMIGKAQDWSSLPYSSPFSPPLKTRWFLSNLAVSRVKICTPSVWFFKISSGRIRPQLILNSQKTSELLWTSGTVWKSRTAWRSGSVQVLPGVAPPAVHRKTRQDFLLLKISVSQFGTPAHGGQNTTIRRMPQIFLYSSSILASLRPFWCTILLLNFYLVILDSLYPLSCFVYALLMKINLVSPFSPRKAGDGQNHIFCSTCHRGRPHF